MKLVNVLCRYIVLLVLVILAYSESFYNIMLWLTIYPTNFLLSFFYSSAIYGNIIFVESAKITMIPACIAISAYTLLLILNLTIGMDIKKRLFSLFFSFAVFLALNIIRIFILSILFVENFFLFDSIHKLFWYSLSTLFVVAIWFFSAYLFKIKGIPVYSDYFAIKRELKKR